MKFVFIKLKIINGEYAHEAMSTHGVSDDVNIIEFARDFAASYYEVSPSYTEYDYFYFHVGSIALKVDVVRALARLPYLILVCYIVLFMVFKYLFPRLSCPAFRLYFKEVPYILFN